MLNSTTLKPFTPQQKHFGPSFKGDKDIVIIEDNYFQLESIKRRIKQAVGDGYTIHEARGGKAGLVAVDKYKPKLTITAFHMPQYGQPYGENLIKALNKLNTNVIVFSNCWEDEINIADEGLKKGVETCENKCGAKKFVSQLYISIFLDSIKAILNDEEPPRYYFQQDPITEFGKKIKDVAGKLKGLISHKNKT